MTTWWQKNCPSHSSTCNIVSYSHCSESDHYKVDGLQCGPTLNVFEDDSWDGDEDDAASQDEQDGGCHSDLSLTDLFVFLLKSERERDREKKNTDKLLDLT